jgi:hypothetical protein
MSKLQLYKKKYKDLYDEREAILDEIYDWKHGRYFYAGVHRLGLWNNSIYLDELLYIRKRIEKDIIPYEIMFRTEFYKKLMEKIPDDIILHIASFGDIIDKSAANLIISGEDITLDIIKPTFKKYQY